MQNAPTDTTAPSDTAGWRQHFEVRAKRHSEVVAEPPLAMDRGHLKALGQSLATFQLGESGDGHHLISAARVEAGDEAYVFALQSFIVEEQEHARLLGLVLSAMDQPLRTSHWSDHVFVLVRRRLRSFRTEVLTLLVAELIALRYYSALRDGLCVHQFSEVLDRIHADEVRHVEFHVSTLPRYLAEWSAPTRSTVRVMWNVLVFGTSVLVALDHRPALQAAGFSSTRFVADLWTIRKEADQRLFGH